MKNLTTALRGTGLLAVVALGLLAACNKSGEEVQLSTPAFSVGKPVDNTAPLGGAIKGTMKQDLEYDVSADVFVNAGDTLVLQPGVKVNFLGNFNFVIKGTLLSLGSQAKPIYFQAKNPSTKQVVAHTDQVGADPATDPAYQGLWGGIRDVKAAKKPLDY